jgi:hypothetical protein
MTSKSLPRCRSARSRRRAFGIEAEEDHHGELKATLDNTRAGERRTRKAKRAVVDLDSGSPDADERRARVTKAASNVVQMHRRSKA